MMQVGHHVVSLVDQAVIVDMPLVLIVQPYWVLTSGLDVEHVNPGQGLQGPSGLKPDGLHILFRYLKK